MTNIELMTEYVNGENKYNACNHLGYAKDTLWNYSTDICEIDRKALTARVNIRKYSTTTSKIQNQLINILQRKGYLIEEFDGEPCRYWNYGYQGADTIKRNDARKIFYCMG